MSDARDFGMTASEATENLREAVAAWERAGLRLEPWQLDLVDRMYSPTAPPLTVSTGNRRSRADAMYAAAVRWLERSL